jgi:DNA-binding PadR family transcriptional regulator
MVEKKNSKKNLKVSDKINKFPFEEDIKKLLSNEINKDPEEFVEKMIGEFKNHWVFGKRSFLGWAESPEINPFINMILTRSGLLPLYTMHLLQKRKMYGNEIMSEIEKRTFSTWSPNPGAIYPLLKELEEEKFVKGHWDTEKEHPRKIYEITKKGKEEYKILRLIFKKQICKAAEILEKMFIEIYPEEIKRKREAK